MKSTECFFRSKKFIAMNCSLLLTFLACLLFSTPLMADNAADLAKSANTLIRNAERAMYDKKTDQSVKLLEEARTALDQLKAADPGHPQLKGLESKYDRTKKQVDKKLGSAQTRPSSTSPAPAAKNADSGKLPAGVSKRLRDIDRQLTTVERYLAKEDESSIKQADYNLNEAKNLFDEIDKSYGSQFDPSHPDYAAETQRFNALKEKIKIALAGAEEKKAGARADQTAMEEQSAEWTPKFQAYLSYPGNEGHDPDLLVYIPGTSEPEKFADAQKRYEDFKAFYETYKRVEFPHGKTEKLEALADREAPERLADFEQQFASRAEEVAGNAEKQIAQAMTQLEKDRAWEKDSAAKPRIVDSKWMTAIEDSVKKTQIALGEKSPGAEKIQNSFAALVAKDQEYRKIRADRTFLSPETYQGPDRKELVQAAGDIAVREKPGSKILKITIYKSAWEEKTVEGWTDTTKTQWEKKTFKQINAHVAAKDSSGVYLHVLHLAKDKTSEGWGNIYGHIMFSDPMAEKNVEK